MSPHLIRVSFHLLLSSFFQSVWSQEELLVGPKAFSRNQNMTNIIIKDWNFFTRQKSTILLNMKDIKERIFFSRRAKLLQLSRDAAGSPSSPDDASPSDQTSKEVGCQKEKPEKLESLQKGWVRKR